MHIEDYFDFLSADEIRLKGHRIGIEIVLDAYLHHGMTAEKIQETWPTLTLEEVYATILYYLHHREAMEAYMARWLADCQASEEEANRQPLAPGVKRLLELKAELEKYPPEERLTVMPLVVSRQNSRQKKERLNQEVA